jgi:hypothetical protein
LFNGQCKEDFHDVDAQTYNNFTAQLLNKLLPDDRIIGLVALGSMANEARRDEYSDHDFFLIVEPLTQPWFRQNLDWLPDSTSIVLCFQETAHGLKVMYESGHLIEFAVFDPEEMLISKANEYKILLDRTDIAQRMQQVTNATTAPEYDYLKEFLHFLSLLQVGAGRYERGETLSGHIFIKSHALCHLLPVLTYFVPISEKAILDTMDPFRRFEFAYPDIGEALQLALLKSPPEAALELLRIVEKFVKPSMPDFPEQAVDTVRCYLQNLRAPRRKGD